MGKWWLRRKLKKAQLREKILRAHVEVWSTVIENDDSPAYQRALYNLTLCRLYVAEMKVRLDQ